jgi:pyruvate formate lyase activating enzyme
MTENPYTESNSLQIASEIGQEAGLNFVYAGNLPGRVGSLENTFCPHCNFLLITRNGYVVRDYRITAQGHCPRCGKSIPGIWTNEPRTVRLDGWGTPHRI